MKLSIFPLLFLSTSLFLAPSIALAGNIVGDTAILPNSATTPPQLGDLIVSGVLDVQGGQLAVTGAGTGTGVNFLLTNSLGANKLSVQDNGTVIVGAPTTSSVTKYGVTTLTPQFQVVDTGAPASILVHRFTASTSSGRFYFLKTRGTTKDDFASVQANDELGAISWAGSNGSVPAEGARIAPIVKSTNNGNAFTATDLCFFTSPGGSTVPARRMTVTATGEIGIGTSLPAKKLDVNGDAVVRGSLSVTASLRIAPQGDLSMGTYTQGPLP